MFIGYSVCQHFVDPCQPLTLIVPQSTDTQSLAKILRNVQGLHLISWYK